MRADEIKPKKLVVFDIDDTLVYTQTKVHVVKDGKTVNSLNSHDFTHYKLQPGEEFDFGDFRNAKDFFDNSKPNIPMMSQLKRDINTGNKVVMVTARADFDDKELFLDTFRKFGVDMSKVHVYRAGNSKQGTTEERKKAIIKKLLDSGDYTKAIMYDDAKPNLHTFMELKKDHPKTRFYAWHVSLDGNASEYMREQIEETIRKQGDKYVIYSKDGSKKLGTYTSRKAAEKRLGQIEYFKHKESIEEKWSEKYKRSINCSNPKGFSQKAHCAGRKKSEDQHPNEKPIGAEFKPTMPKGTIRVKVSDVYDWYKLGMHISDLEGLGKHDFGKGPPEAILSFGSEKEEHEYIELLKQLGLEIIDIDPGKTKGVESDPTYNIEDVSEGEFRANDVEEFKPDNDALNDLKSKYLPDWEMLDHRILQAKYVADDHRAAEAFVRIINRLSEKMDHFCEVTQDVAEVTVRTTTFDVKGLTILDFQIAMVIDRFASDVGIKQVPMSGNFGMHEGIDLDEGVIDDIVKFLEPYVEKAKGKIANLRSAIKQEFMETELMWEIIKKGTAAKDHEVNFANKQLKDILKGVGLSAWLALPIPGNTVWITMLEKLLNKFDISIMPDEVKRQVFNSMYENFADGKVKGKSRPGRVKRAGASCKGSVTDLRAKARKYGGEKGKMYHWCANMKGGKK